MFVVHTFRQVSEVNKKKFVDEQIYIFSNCLCCNLQITEFNVSLKMVRGPIVRRAGTTSQGGLGPLKILGTGAFNFVLTQPKSRVPRRTRNECRVNGAIVKKYADGNLTLVRTLKNAKFCDVNKKIFRSN